jgi:hypothetical protein
MGYLLQIILAVLLGASAWAQLIPGNFVEIQDEGTIQGRVRALNCTGAGVVCSVSGITGTLDVSGGGGGGGSANIVEVSINLGTDMGWYYTTTVTGQAWVSGTSVIACSMFGTTADGQTPETIAVAGIIPTVANRVAGTGFDLSIYNPHGATGLVRAHCTGA